MILFKMFKLAVYKRRMKNLPLKIQKKIVRAMARAGATVIKKDFKARLKQHKRTGSMQNAVAVKVAAYKGVMVGMVGVRKDVIYADKRGNKVIPGNYNHLVELGRRSFLRKWYNKKKGQRFKDNQPRRIKAARPFAPLDNAKKATTALVRAKMEEVFITRLKAEVEKL